MFEKMMTDMQAMMKPYQENLGGKQFQPISNLMILQAKTLEKLGSEQTRFYTECVEAITKQVENITKTTDKSKLQEAQVNFAQDMQSRVSRLFKTNMDIITEARENATSEVEALKTQAKAKA
ncbi:MAG: hypothetical protein GX029_02215 [Pseudomonadaceae bacterium]|nr:hypothetical protein [Pseudomonadaceae bacterium]